MLPGSLPEVFGAAAVGVLAISWLLALWWTVRLESESFHEFVIRVTATRQSWLLGALLLLGAYGGGLILQDVTDNLTDSEYRAIVEHWYWPPRVQHELLGKESFHRTRSLTKPRKGEGYKLNGLGRDVLEIEGLVEAGRHRLERARDEAPWADRGLNARERVDSLNEFLASRDIGDDEVLETFGEFVSGMYYLAKNWCYLEADGVRGELDAIQRRIDFSRTIFLESFWACLPFLFILVVSAGSIILLVPAVALFGKKARKLRRKIWRASLAWLVRSFVFVVLAVVLASVGWIGYRHAENMFNERAFGYYVTHTTLPTP